MLKRLINWLIDDSEKKTGESADWMRDIARVSTRSFFVFGMFTPLATHRRALPLHLHHLARIAAIAEADCGPCFQTVVNYAVQDGIDKDLIKAAIEGDTSRMNDLEATVFGFASAVARKEFDDGSARQKIIDTWGEQALIDLAYAVAGVRVFPTVKRAMGYAQACQILDLKGEPVHPQTRLEAA